jgi:hypothetical protein
MDKGKNREPEIVGIINRLKRTSGSTRLKHLLTRQPIKFIKVKLTGKRAKQQRV